MEVFQEAKDALKQAMTKLENAPINANNIDRVLYKLNALKEDLKMLHYHITDIIVESKTPPLQYNVRITPPYEPLLSAPHILWLPPAIRRRHRRRQHCK